jgi:hypothetical protein
VHTYGAAKSCTELIIFKGELGAKLAHRYGSKTLHIHCILLSTSSGGSLQSTLRQTYNIREYIIRCSSQTTREIVAGMQANGMPDGMHTQWHMYMIVW